MMDDARKRAADERHAAELNHLKAAAEAAQQQATAAEQRAEEARRAEEVAAAPFVALTRAAEEEELLLASAAAAVQAALDELQPQAKQQRTDEEEAEPKDSKKWSRTTFVQQETAAQTRRAVRVRDDAPQLPIQGGSQGALMHPRRGLVGAVHDWARGSRANVVKLVLRLVKFFGIEDDVRGKLDVKQSRAAQLDEKIVDRVVAALQLLKPCALCRPDEADRAGARAAAATCAEKGRHAWPRWTGRSRPPVRVCRREGRVSVCRRDLLRRRCRWMRWWRCGRS